MSRTGSGPNRRGLRTVDAGVHATEPIELLQAAGDLGPCLLVGHSYSRIIVSAFAVEYPQSVAGVLLLDAGWLGIHCDLGSGYASHWHEGGTKFEISASSREARGGSSGFDPAHRDRGKRSGDHPHSQWAAVESPAGGRRESLDPR